MNSECLRGRRFLVIPALILVLVWVVQAEPAAYSLKNVMSYMFPGNLVYSPAGDKVAWVFNDRGVRNIWFAEAPEYKARPLTRYTEDDGQELGDLAFGTEGNVVLYVRGGSPNRAGEIPNPTSDPAGAEQEVWAVPLDGGEPRRLGQGSNPSPWGSKVLFSRRGQIFIGDLNEEPEPRATPLFKARGRNREARWSPDGKKIAFVSSREDHSFIGIYDLENKTIRWMAPSVDRDAYPVWSPDSRRLAFIRFPAMMGFSFRGGTRFSLLVGDVKSLKAREVWRCPNDTGGFAQYYPSETLRWAAGDHLVFYSEHEKWMHLYAYSLNDDKLKALTSGEFEVEDSVLSRDGKTLVFSSNQGDIDRRHLWTVPVSGGVPRLLTPGQGIEWSPVLTAESSDLVFLCSNARQPAAPAVLDGKTRQRRLIAPENIPSSFLMNDLVEPKPVVFDAPDGLNIHAQLFLPHGAKPGDKRPAVLFMHGGPIRQMLLGWHMRGYYHNAYALNQYLASRGYVVLSVNYRSGIGYGFDFRTAPNQGPRGASEYQDIVAAGRYIQQRPEVDPNRIGLWGGSYGGYLTAMGLARDSQLFAAGVDLHGVHDWSLRGRRRDGGGWDIRGEDLMAQAYQSSPVADIDFWTSPVLFIHGDDDRNVDFIQTTDLVMRLRRLGKASIELLIIPDEVHGFLRHKNWLKVYAAASDFFDRHLKRPKEAR